MTSHVNRMLTSVLFGVLTLLAGGIAADAQAVLSEDAYISFSSANGNFGSNPALTVSQSNISYVKFKMSPILPSGTSGAMVAKATAKLYIAKVGTPGKIDVYAVADSWNETTITSSNRPGLGGVITTTAQIEKDKEGHYIVLDLTTLVQSWLGDDGQGTNGIPNFGIALVAHPVDGSTPKIIDITFDSKENSQTSHDAQLNVQLDTSAGNLQAVSHDSTLTGDGTVASPLGVADGGVTETKLADDAVTGDKIADSAVGTTQLADGSVTSSKISAPLSLTSSDANFTLSAANTGSGAAIKAQGPIDTTTQYNIGGSRVLTVSGGGPFAGSNTFTGINAGQMVTPAANGSFDGNLNTFYGAGSGKSVTTGWGNTFLGNSSGQTSTTAVGNVFVGGSSGVNHTTGFFNTFVGDFSGSANTTGSNNTALGYFADVASNNLSFATAIGSGAVVNSSNTLVLGRPLDTVQIPGSLNSNILNAATQFNLGGSKVISNAGFQNLFVGAGSGVANTTGFGNTFLGFGTGVLTTSGWGNTFIGQRVGEANTIGCCNSFMGNGAGLLNSSGSSNVFIGGSAGGRNTTGSFNTFIGDVSAWGSPGSSTGSSNTFVGYGTGLTNATGNNITLLGTSANVGSANLNFATAIGAGAIVSANNTIVLGRAADTVRVPGIFDAATQFSIGGNRVFSVSGSQLEPNSNIFAGVGAGASNPTGVGNTFFGRNAGSSTTTASSNSFFGIDAGQANTTGFGNAFFGAGAGLKNTTATFNAFFGGFSGNNNTTGGFNAFFGASAGVQNTTGGFNAFFGSNAGSSNTTGIRNTFVGNSAGILSETTNDNTFIGAGASFSGFNPTGNNNTLLGSNTLVDSATSNSSAIGYRAQVTQSNSLVLGGISGVNGGTNTNVGIGTTAPQARLDVRNGNILVGSPGQGIILKSPDGATCRLLSIDNTGAMIVTAMACP